MKRLYIFVLILTLINRNIHAQEFQLPQKELTNSYIELFSKSDSEETILTRIFKSSYSFFSTRNKPFIAAVAGLQRKLKITTDSSVLLVFDTIMHDFFNNHLWDEYPGILEKNENLYSYYNNATCPCLTERIIKSPYYKLKENDMNECALRLLADTSYINTIRRVTGDKTVNDLYSISKLATLYAMQHCSAIHNYCFESVKGYAVYNCMGDLANRFRNAVRDVVTYYDIKDITALANLFPGYKKFEPQIKQVSLFIKKFKKNQFTGTYLIKNILPSGNINCSMTYYTSNNDTPTILGQVTYSFKSNMPDAPLQAIKLITQDKINNKAAIIKKIGQDVDVTLPPPRME